MKKRLIPIVLLLCICLSSCSMLIPTPPFTSAVSPAKTGTNAVSVPATEEPQTAAVTPTDPEPETTEPLPEPVRVSFLAAGDNVIHPNIYTEAKRRATEDSREYNFLPIYDDVADLIKNADLAFINQETLMGGEELGYSGYPCFNSPQDLGYDLRDLGFDIVNIANNHMCDKREKGLANTIAFWKAMEGVTMLGGNESREDFDTLRITECKGVKIVWLSYTYGTNGISLPSSSELFIPYIDRDLIKEQLDKAQDLGDLVFVSIHWGEENHFDTSSEQKELAQFMADNGADAIIGHHPHVVQPIEWLDGAHGKVLCVYSLGNLISGMANGYNMLGGFMTFDIVKDSLDRPRIENPLFIPTAFYYADSWYQTKLYLLENYDQEISLTHGSRKHGKLTDREGMEKLLTKTVDREFLPDWLFEEGN